SLYCSNRMEMPKERGGGILDVSTPASDVPKVGVRDDSAGGWVFIGSPFQILETTATQRQPASARKRLRNNTYQVDPPVVLRSLLLTPRLHSKLANNCAWAIVALASVQRQASAAARRRLSRRRLVGSGSGAW